MYKTARTMLILAVVAFGYCVTVAAMRFGNPVVIGIGILVVAGLVKRRHAALTAHGTARWADADDLRSAGMLDADSGLILGRVPDASKPSFPKALRGLLDPRTTAQEASEKFLAAIQIGSKRRPNRALVRMPHAVHTMF